MSRESKSESVRASSTSSSLSRRLKLRSSALRPRPTHTYSVKLNLISGSIWSSSTQRVSTASIIVMKPPLRQVRQLQMPSSSIATSAKKIRKSFSKCWSNTTPSWLCSMVNCERSLTITQSKAPCSFLEIKSLTSRVRSQSISSLRTTPWTSSGTCATRASSTVQLIRKVSFRRSSFKTPFWWTSKIKLSTVRFSTRISSSALPCLTWTFRSSTLTWSVSRQLKQELGRVRRKGVPISWAHKLTEAKASVPLLLS